MKSFLMNKKVNIVFVLVLFGFCACAEENSPKPESLLQRIVDSYVDSSNTNQTLKYLLDAKMYVSTAEHDLLVSHDKESAQVDLENALSYLIEAEEVAKPEIKNQISLLIPNLKSLERKTLKEKMVDQDDKIDLLLKTAQSQLLEAQNIDHISQSIKQRIKDIRFSIQELRAKIEHNNLKEDYEAIMNTLNSIIHKL